MIETNIKIVRFGSNLHLDVRRARVIMQNVVPELVEKTCNALAGRHHLSAVKDSANRSQILVLTNEQIPNITLEDNNWHLEIEDIGKRRLHFSKAEDQFLMTQLLERSLLKRLSQMSNLWMLDSYRMFYENNFFDRIQDVAGYRRYEIASVPIEGVGIGLIVDIGTAFFTVRTVADYFRQDVSKEEKEKLLQRFNRLLMRQNGSRGTLLYTPKPGKHNKCHFDSFCPEITASTTGKIRIGGETFESLQDYYKIKHKVKVADNEPVAKVSFQGIPYPVFVAASKLRLRVMNNALPRQLKNADKIPPEERREMIDQFWKSLGSNPLGKGKPQVEKDFWQPHGDKLFHAKAPDLLFRDGKILQAPLNGHIGEHKEFYSKRLSYLYKYGCFYVPPSVPRTVYVALPKEFGEPAAECLADSVSELLSDWMKMNIDVVPLLYNTQEEAIKNLKNETSSGVVLFVFDEENPTAYFNIAYELSGWRIKRITKSKLAKLASEFVLVADARGSGKIRVTQTPSTWHSFIELNVLDILQQMDCVPYTLAENPAYTARLAIDVGENFRFFALSVIIFQNGKSQPFRLDTEVENKTDSKKEVINEVVLEDKIVELCERAVKAGFVNLESLLFERDGRQCGKENDAIEAARKRLLEIGFLSNVSKTDAIDFHKNSVKGIRIWYRKQDGKTMHAIEGTGIKLNRRMVAITNTGAATLRNQGTAEPVVLESRDENLDLVNVAEDVHKSCHLNWSNPRIAQKLSLELKRTDDELKNRSSQEVRRLK